MQRELTDFQPEVQVKLVEFAWEAARKRGGVNATVRGLVSDFSEALDGLVRGCESAGKEHKAQ